jgi:hypothetical protein
MEVIKRKILLEKSINRNTDTVLANCNIKSETIEFDNYNYLTTTGGGEVRQADYGELKNCVFYVPLFLTQNLDDMGMFHPVEFIPEQPLTTPPDNLDTAERPIGVTAEMYHSPITTITGTTNDKQLSRVEHPQVNLPYQPYVNLAEDSHYAFDGVITYQPTTQVVTYVIGGDVTNAGTLTGPHNYVAGTGVIYTTYLNQYVDNIDPVTGDNNQYRRTTFTFQSKGVNENNITLSAVTKHEEFLGVVFPQEVQSEVFIERGSENIFEKHMVMAEIKTVEDIDSYRGGYLVNVID